MEEVFTFLVLMTKNMETSSMREGVSDVASPFGGHQARSWTRNTNRTRVVCEGGGAGLLFAVHCAGAIKIKSAVAISEIWTYFPLLLGLDLNYSRYARGQFRTKTRPWDVKINGPSPPARSMCPKTRLKAASTELGPNPLDYCSAPTIFCDVNYDATDLSGGQTDALTPFYV